MDNLESGNVRYYFDDKTKQIELKKILESWEDTPFRHHCGVKGMGTDCIFFVARVFEELGVLKWRKNLIPEYAPDWHLHNTEQRLFKGLVKELNVKPVGFENLLNGDIILYQFGKASSHASILYDNHVYQAVNDIGIIRLHYLDETWNKRKEYNLRVLA